MSSKWVARLCLAVILCTGGAMRFLAAATDPVEGIEEYEFIPTAMTLSWDHHPIRASQHGAVPNYLIRASGLVFGTSTLGLRMFSVLAGIATILFLFLIARLWWGPVPGLIAAALLAVERYHTEISARAIDLPFDQFFLAAAMYCASRFLHATRLNDDRATASWLYAAAAATAFGFLCKEFTALMMPVVFVTLWFSGRRSWLLRREPWFAAALFFVLIAPDVYSSLTVTQADRADLFARQKEALRQRGGDLAQLDYEATGLYMSHGDQLSRFHGIGLNIEPYYFYFGDLLTRMGLAHRNSFDEFPFLTPPMAVLLWLGVAVSLMQRRKDDATKFLLTMFVLMFLPFSLVQIGPPRGTFETDSQALWYWVDRTMLPAMLLTGFVLNSAIQRIHGDRPTESRSYT